MDPGGLSRRRTHGRSASRAASLVSSGSYDPDKEDSETLPTTGASSKPSSLAAATTSKTVRTTAEDGHTIAYDLRDWVEGAENEQAKPPRLTIMEEIVLLGLRDDAGYLSFWNQNISYALRGAVLLELALRGRIGVVRDSARLSLAVQERGLHVVSRVPTGEVILDEALQKMALYEAHQTSRGSNKRKSSVQWTDVLAGETWDWTQIQYQLRAVRDRLAKGLVDKGVLRTQLSNFVLFDMAIHPLADASAKHAVLKRIHSVLLEPLAFPDFISSPPSAPTTASAAYADPALLFPHERKPVSFPLTRALCTVCTALAANVLENALANLPYTRREAAFERAEALLKLLGQWPMAPSIPSGRIGDPSILQPSSSSNGSKPPTSTLSSIAQGSVYPPGEIIEDLDSPASSPALTGLISKVALELQQAGGSAFEPQFEAIAGIMATLARMDCLI